MCGLLLLLGQLWGREEIAEPELVTVRVEPLAVLPSPSLCLSTTVWLHHWQQVDDWKTQSSWGIVYTNYRVTSSWTAAEIRRRYSDFEWIRELLASRYNGMYLAPLPPKLLMNNSIDIFKVHS